MFRQAFVTALSFALLLGASHVSAASDWVEDDRVAGMPRVAPDRNAPHATQNAEVPSQKANGGFLTGSATHFGATTRPGLPPLNGRALVPSNAQVNLGADADQFLAGVQKDTVVPPEMMRGWLDRSHPEFKLSAQSNPESVIEVKGAWDKAGQILNGMGIRHHEIKARELRELSLNHSKVMVINCEGKIPEDCTEKIRQWVIRGGYLISTDWALHGFVERAFPGMIAWNGAKTPGTTVDAIIVTPDLVLFHGVPVARAPWKLDEESQMVKVLRPDVVRVLARSYKLSARDPNRQSTSDPNQLGILACEFPYGRGRVLHLVGHYDYNSPLTFSRNVLPDAIPGAGIGLRQAVSTNFLIEGLSKPTHTANVP